jgi:mRNA-degrading endonuclease RelE of RelBE toxin-antitoxin system
LHIRRLRRSDPRAAAATVVALEQVSADPRLIDKLTTVGDVDFGARTVNVKPWITVRKANQNLWRLRVLNTPATSYRIVYGYHWQLRQLRVLAVVHKEDMNYDKTNSDLVQRILADWIEFTGGQAT